MFDGRMMGWWGRDCAKCGKPVHPPTNRYMKAAMVLNDRIWHGECFPAEGVSGTFTVGGDITGI